LNLIQTVLGSYIGLVTDCSDGSVSFSLVSPDKWHVSVATN